MHSWNCKTPRGTQGQKLLEIGLDNVFLAMTTKAQETKQNTDKEGYIKSHASAQPKKQSTE
jgi:adenosylcobinamide amidohydrolase